MPIGSLSGSPRNPSKYAVLVTAHLETSKRKHSHHIYFSTISLNSERRKKPGSPNSELLLLKTAADEIYFKQSRTHKHGKTRSELGLRGTWAQSSRECRDPGRGLHGAPSAARGCRDGWSPLPAKLHPDPGLFRRCSHRKGAPPGRPALSPTRLHPGHSLGGAEQSAGLRLQSHTEDTVPSLWGPCPCPTGKRCPFPSETNRESLRQDPAAVKQHLDQGRAHVLCKGPDRQSVGLWGPCSICGKPSALARWQEGSPGCLSTHRQDWVPIKLYRP